MPLSEEMVGYEGLVGMEWLRKHVLRDSRRLGDMIPIALLEAFLLMIVGSILWVLAVLVFPFLHDYEEPGLSGFEQMLSQYLMFTGIWPVFGLAMLIPEDNRRMIRDILPNGHGNTLRGIALGLLGGFGLNAICILISLLLGDIGLSFDAFEPLPFLALFGAVLIQSGAEEIVDRQFLYEKLRRRYRSPWVAIVVNSLFFTALHLGNDGIGLVPLIEILLIGLDFSLFMYYFDSLWACIFFHTAWNFTQNILFGCPNSGVVSAYSVFRLEAAAKGPFFDPVFGVEGSVGSCILLGLLAVGIIVYAKARRLKGYDLWEGFDESALPPEPTNRGPLPPEGALPEV